MLPCCALSSDRTVIKYLDVEAERQEAYKEIKRRKDRRHNHQSKSDQRAVRQRFVGIFGVVSGWDKGSGGSWAERTRDLRDAYKSERLRGNTFLPDWPALDGENADAIVRQRWDSVLKIRDRTH